MGRDSQRGGRASVRLSAGSVAENRQAYGTILWRKQTPAGTGLPLAADCGLAGPPPGGGGPPGGNALAARVELRLGGAALGECGAHGESEGAEGGDERRADHAEL